jgi:hypothetical protein
VGGGLCPTPVQSVPITTKVVSSNTVHGEVYSIQHYVIKFVRNLRQVGDFLQFPPTFLIYKCDLFVLSYHALPNRSTGKSN